MKQAVSLFVDDGKFNMGAKYEKEIAELYEAEGDLNNAIQHYETASDYFETENATSTSISCLLKVAHFAAQMKNFKRAYEIFEQAATVSAANNLLKYSVKDYLLKGGLCHLCEGDIVGTRKAVTKYSSIGSEFMGSREYTFLNSITDAFENHDLDAFTASAQDFDAVLKLDPWKTSILLDLREKLEKDDDADDLM